MNKKIIVSSVIVIIVAVVAGVFVMQKMSKVTIEQKNQQQSNQQSVQDNKQQAVDTRDWNTFRNDVFGYEIKYPVNWEFDEYDGTTFSYKVSQEIRKLGGSEIARELINEDGDLVVNISVDPGIKKYFDDVRNWRKNDTNNALNNGEKYYFINLSFSNDVLVFPEKKNRMDNLKVASYYFFHNNDGYGITVYYSKDSNGLAEKMMKTLKFDN